MLVSDLVFNLTHDFGITAYVYLPNNYGLEVTKKPNNLYDIVFLIKVKENIWGSDMDNNLNSISVENNLHDLTEADVNTYISKLENIV